MGIKALTSTRLAFENLRHKAQRTAGLITVAALVAFVLASGGILAASLKNGLDSMRARLGADLIVVPLGYDGGMEGILLKGEPAYFYFDKSVEGKVKSVKGVKSVSSQFFLTSSNQSCCSVPVQFIGFDPDTDFSVQPWISEVYKDSLRDGELIAGHDIALDEDKRLKFFGKKYGVAAKLKETGTSFDQAVYANMNTIRQLFEEAKKSGLNFTRGINPDESISSVLVRIEEGYTADQVIHSIRSSFDGLQVIKTKSMVSSIAESLGKLVAFIYILVPIFFLCATLMLAIVFSVTAGERRKEFATLRALGATGNTVSALVIKEALLVCTAGGIAGTALSTLLLPLSQNIGESLGLPYLRPSPALALLVLALSLAVSVGMGPAASLYTAVRLNQREVYPTIREGE